MRHVGGTLIFECDYDVNCLNINGLPPFYHEVLVAWSQVQALNSASRNVRTTDTIIWNNKTIKIAGKSVYFRDWHQVGIKTIKALLNEKNEFLPYHSFCEKFNLNTPFTMYYGLVTAIPSEWKRDLREHAQNNPPNNDKVETSTLTDLLVGKLTCKTFRNILIEKDFQEPRASHRLRR